jgi:hypothetical protein
VERKRKKNRLHNVIEWKRQMVMDTKAGREGRYEQTKRERKIERVEVNGSE